jgi:hypothetical protein
MRNRHGVQPHKASPRQENWVDLRWSQARAVDVRMRARHTHPPAPSLHAVRVIELWRRGLTRRPRWGEEALRWRPMRLAWMNAMRVKVTGHKPPGAREGVLHHNGVQGGGRGVGVARTRTHIPLQVFCFVTAFTCASSSPSLLRIPWVKASSVVSSLSSLYLHRFYLRA